MISQGIIGEHSRWAGEERKGRQFYVVSERIGFAAGARPDQVRKLEPPCA